MTRKLDDPSGSGKRTIWIGLALLTGGPVLSYFLDRYNYFKIIENSAYPVSLADMIYPPACAFAVASGVVLVLAGLLGRTRLRDSRVFVYAIAGPLTILYTLFVFGMWFVDSGADRLGECPGLVEAATASNLIPPSRINPRLPAVGCGVDLRATRLFSIRLFDVDYVKTNFGNNFILGNSSQNNFRLQSGVQLRF